MTPKLPPPKHLRRQQRRDGGYDMVPAYTAEEMLAYGVARFDAGLEAAAKICEAEARLGVDDERAHNGRRIAEAIRKEITP